MYVKVFAANNKYCVCAELPDGTMDPEYCSIPDIDGKGNAHYIADRINEAYRRGQNDKAREIRKALYL
jgi:hypothetical protein